MSDSFLDRVLARHKVAELPYTKPDKTPEDHSTAGRFEAFHRANPHLLPLLRDMALAMKAQGFKRCGMKMLFEKLRWEYYVRTTGKKYKLTNTFTAYYARLVMLWCPSLDGFFRVNMQPAEPLGCYVPRWDRLSLTPGGGETVAAP